MGNQKVTYSAILGIVLLNFRNKDNFEQSYIAERMGISQASYSRLESGKSSFTFDQLFQVANALNIEPGVILEEVANYSSHLERDGTKVEPQTRGNSTKSSQSKNNDPTTFIAGAALGALLFSILSKK